MAAIAQTTRSRPDANRPRRRGPGRPARAAAIAVLATRRKDDTVMLSPVWFEWRDGGINIWVPTPEGRQGRTRPARSPGHGRRGQPGLAVQGLRDPGRGDRLGRRLLRRARAGPRSATTGPRRPSGWSPRTRRASSSGSSPASSGLGLRGRGLTRRAALARRTGGRVATPASARHPARATGPPHRSLDGRRP